MAGATPAPATAQYVQVPVSPRALTRKTWGARPENAIRDLGIDPDWEPYAPTPIFPGYVSGHGAYSGAAQMVMSYLFPERAEVFRERAEEASISRLYVGIHYEPDNSEALKLGRKVGTEVVEYARTDGAGER